LADKLDANSISRMFRREVTRGLQNENRSVFLVDLFLHISNISHLCNLRELIGAINSSIQLVGAYLAFIENNNRIDTIKIIFKRNG